MADSIEMGSILENMGWDRRYDIPVANKENRELELQLQQKQVKLQNMRENLVRESKRVSNMVNQQKQVNQEFIHTMNLIHSRKKDLESTKNIITTASREEGRLEQEVSRLKLTISEYKDTQNILENKLFQQNSIIERKREKINWDKNVLEAWLEESIRKDQDVNVLQNYIKMDQGKIKQLTMDIEKLTLEEKEGRDILLEKTNELSNIETEMDKTALQFRESHLDRQKLLNHWEEVIKQMQNRDIHIAQVANLLEISKNKLDSLKSNVADKNIFLYSEEGNNVEKQAVIDILDRRIAKLRFQLLEREKVRDRFNSDFQTLKRTFDRAAHDLESCRVKNKLFKQQIIERTNQYKKEQESLDKLEKQLRDIVSESLSSEKELNRVKQLLDESMEKYEMASSELKSINNTRFAKIDLRNKTQSNITSLNANVENCAATIRSQNDQLKKLEENAFRQQEIIYNQDFTVQQLEQRIGRLQGDTNNEEKVVLDAKIKDLTQELQLQKESTSKLSKITQKLNDDLRRVSRETEKDTINNSKLVSKLDGFELNNQNGLNEYDKVKREKQDIIVENNLLKLEQEKLSKIIQTQSTRAINLESLKLQLETASKERRNEIQVHKNMLASLLKSAESEKSHIIAELHDRKNTIDKIKRRYEILTISMAPPEGKENSSQAYYIIKAAQEKEMIMRDVEQLTSKIKQTNLEITALKNTLNLVNGKNEMFRKCFNIVNENDAEFQEQARLLEQQRNLLVKQKVKTNQLSDKSSDTAAMTLALEKLTQDEKNLKMQVENGRNLVQEIQKSIMDLNTKLERAKNMYRKNKGGQDLKRFILDMEYRYNKRFLKEMMNILKPVSQIPEMADYLKEMLNNLNVHVDNLSVTSSIAQSSTSINSEATSISSYRSSGSSASNESKISTKIATLDLNKTLEEQDKDD